MSVTITNAARTLTLDFAPIVIDEPNDARVSRAREYSVLGTPITTEVRKTQARTRLRLRLRPLTKAQADTLHTMLGETGLVTINVMKQFPVTTTNPTSYQGTWGPDGSWSIKPALADAYPRDEHTTWDATPSDLQVYEAEVELAVLRNDEPA